MLSGTNGLSTLVAQPLILTPTRLKNTLEENKKRDNDEEGYYFKFYGLPIKIPKDRHRWFLTVKDIEFFFEYLAKEKNLKVSFFSSKLE